MKIAILTLPLHTNYGGILQAYALQTVLEKMGHTVEHLQPKITYPFLHNPMLMPIVWLKRIYVKYFKGEYENPIFKHPQKYIRKNTDEFINTFIKCKFLDESDWNSTIGNLYDAIILGSDQVWRLEYAIPFERYFLSFLGDSTIKKIVYGASFGSDDVTWSKTQIAKSRSLVESYAAISVREVSAINLCNTLWGRTPDIVLDPTMLLDVNFYKSLFTKELHCGYHKGILVYILDENQKINEFISNVESYKSLKSFKVNSKVEDYTAPISERVQPPVEHWLKGFMCADFVITDSYHACVFSILFHKPFVCIGNEFRGMSRFVSLLKMFHLENRIIQIDKVDMSQLNNNINWDIVDLELQKQRKISYEFLWKVL